MYTRAKNPRSTRLTYSFSKDLVRRVRKYERRHNLKRSFPKTVTHLLDEVERLSAELAKTNSH